MSKRKQAHEEDEEEQGGQTVDVNFDYYNVNAKVDYHAIERLLAQLFAHDAERIQTRALADLVTRVAEESGVGSTIKTEEDEEADPYAFLTVISCHDHPGVAGVVEYLLSKVDEGFRATLAGLLRGHPQSHVGLVLGERLVNMPVQVVPPMYRLLCEEIDAEVGFTHYLLVSRAYAEEEEETRDGKRRRVSRVRGFHAEDEAIARAALHTATYAFSDAPARDAESVGADLRGRAMLVAAGRLPGLVAVLEQTYGVA